MSFRAFTAVEDVETSSMKVTLLLYVLAQFAGADGACYPSIPTIATKMRCSEGAARSALREAEAAGLLRVEQRSRRDGACTSNRIVLTYYAPEEPLEPLPAEQKAKLARPAELPFDPPANGAGAPSPFEGGPLQTVRGPPSNGEGAFLNQSLNLERADALSASARAVAEGFRRLERAYPNRGRKTTKWKQARTAWAEVSQRYEPERIIAAAVAFAADPDMAKQNFIPALDTWLVEEGFTPWLRSVGEAEPSTGSANEPVRFPDAEIRAAVVRERGEAWTASWLDRCTLADTVVMPPLGIVHDELKRWLKPVLKRFGLALADPRSGAPRQTILQLEGMH